MSFEKSFESLMYRMESGVDRGYSALAGIAANTRRNIGALARAGAVALLVTGGAGACLVDVGAPESEGGCAVIPSFPDKNLGVDASTDGGTPPDDDASKKDLGEATKDTGTGEGEGSSDAGSPPDDDAGKKDLGESEEVGPPDTGTPVTDAGEGADLAKDATVPPPDVPTGDDIPQSPDLGEGRDLATGTDAIVPVPDEGTGEDIPTAQDVTTTPDLGQQPDAGNTTCPQNAACTAGLEVGDFGDCAQAGTPVCNDGRVTGCLGEAGVPHTVYLDGDGDGVGGDEDRAACGDPQGTSPIIGDCDDDDPNNFPGNLEFCDGQQNDCGTGGAADRPGSIDCQDAHIDADADGDGAAGSPADCVCPNPDGTMPEFTSPNDTDCNDADPLINPEAEEIPTDVQLQQNPGLPLQDRDCDGVKGESQNRTDFLCQPGASVAITGEPNYPCVDDEAVPLPTNASTVVTVPAHRINPDNPPAQATAEFLAPQGAPALEARAWNIIGQDGYSLIQAGCANPPLPDKGCTALIAPGVPVAHEGQGIIYQVNPR